MNIINFSPDITNGILIAESYRRGWKISVNEIESNATNTLATGKSNSCK